MEPIEHARDVNFGPMYSEARVRQAACEFIEYLNNNYAYAYLACPCEQKRMADYLIELISNQR